jgi:protein-tyrosine phosphatase
MFVCHGNICRSTMAEYVMKYLVEKKGLSDRFFITSSATSTEEIGNGVHYGTRRKLNEKGIPCGDHRAIQLTKEDGDRYDYIIGMDSANLKNMRRILKREDDKISLLLDFTDRKGCSIADPWYTGDFEETYRDVTEGCHALLKKIVEENL